MRSTVPALVLAALTIVGTVAAPLVVRLYTFSTPASADAETFRRVTTFFAFVFLPQIFFYGVTALASALLNARRRFFAAAWAPVVNNVVVIVALLALPHIVDGIPLTSKSTNINAVRAEVGMVFQQFNLFPHLTALENISLAQRIVRRRSQTEATRVGLELLERYWSGEQVSHHGRHYEVRDVTLLPAPAQRPRPPVWIGGFWPHRRPMRRAALWDGVVPLFAEAGHGHLPPVDQVQDLVAYIEQNRHERTDRPFDIVLGGLTPGDPAEARDMIATLAGAGATWWDERQIQGSDNLHWVAPILKRISQGPPAL